MIPLDYLAVAIAGFMGAVTRAAMGKVIKTGLFPVFPLNTLVINLTGSLVLSFFLTATLERVNINPRLRLAFGTGFLGAYTTFSTFALESVNLMEKGQLWTSLVYIALTSLGCVAAAWIGAAAGRAANLRGSNETETQE